MVIFMQVVHLDRIGAGQAQDGKAVSLVKNLTITGGNITAIALAFSAGIGAGSALDKGESSVTNLVIAGGTITARGANGAGIGAGYSDTRPSSVTVLTILNGHITATSTGSGSGIGAGVSDGTGSSVVSSLRLVKGDITVAPASAKFRAINASSITLLNASVIVKAVSSPAFASSPSSTTPTDLTVLYKNATTSLSEPLTALSGNVIQIGNLVLPTAPKLTISISLGSTTKLIEVEPSNVKSLLTTVSSLGAYRLSASTNGVTLVLLNADGGSTFLVDSARTFFPAAQFSLAVPPTVAQTARAPATARATSTPAPNTPPTIVRTSAPSWGTFSSTGPTVDQSIEFTLKDPDEGQFWSLSWRFDSEAWRPGGPSPRIGENVFKFAASSFTGSRLKAGSHTASIVVTDSDDGESNVISVTYNVNGAAGVLQLNLKVVIGGGIMTMVAALWWGTKVIRKREKEELHDGREGEKEPEITV
jgi:hypothetical protein